MPGKVANLSLSPLKDFVSLTTCFKSWIITHSSSNDCLLLLIRVTEALIPVSWRQVHSAISFAFEFLRKTNEIRNSSSSNV